MNSVAQVNNLSQFVQLVSAARIRNNGLAGGAQKSTNPTPAFKSQAFSNAKPLSAYPNSRQPMSAPAADESVKTHRTRSLGTRFDAYA
jgi:hypothetical protein